MYHGAEIIVCCWWKVVCEMLTGLFARYVKRSTLSVLVFNKEKEKRTKKEKEITPSKKVASCRLLQVFKRTKEKFQKKVRK